MILAAASYSGNENISVGILYRHPDAPAGLGKMALRSVLEIAQFRDECHGVTLSVCNENDHAHALYRSIGFTAICSNPHTVLLALRSKDKIADAIAALASQI